MDDTPGPKSNPFSTRYVQPGALAFLFPGGEGADQLVERLRQSSWWGQVLGPHGAGKTTLLHTLCPLLEQAGRTIDWFTLHGGQRRLSAEMTERWEAWDSQTLVVVDGFEQLAWLARRRLRRQCRRSEAGLLVTCHQNAGLPLLYKVQPELPIVLQLVAGLTESSPRLVDEQQVAQRFESWDGNVREVMFALYDLYELRRCEGS